MKWIRESKSPIELKDTPEMESEALKQGWTKEKKPVKKTTKPVTKKAK
jgi:hypothetical protein